MNIPHDSRLYIMGKKELTMEDFPAIKSTSQAMQPMEVELPWPPAELSPNSREHWTAKNKAAQEAKDYAYYETLSHRFGDWFMPETISATYTFYPPDNRRRDADNFLSRCKAYQDGIFQALDIDDSTIRETTIRWGEVVKGGKVVVRLEELNDD